MGVIEGVTAGRGLPVPTNRSQSRVLGRRRKGGRKPVRRRYWKKRTIAFEAREGAGTSGKESPSTTGTNLTRIRDSNN